MPQTAKANSSNFDLSSDDEEDDSYRPKSRTPPSESFSYVKDYHHERRKMSSSSEGLGNDAINRALNQISRSSFTLRIEEEFLDGLIGQRSSYIMVEQALWSMGVTSTREWLCISRMRH